MLRGRFCAGASRRRRHSGSPRAARSSRRERRPRGAPRANSKAGPSPDCLCPSFFGANVLRRRGSRQHRRRARLAWFGNVPAGPRQRHTPSEPWLGPGGEPLRAPLRPRRRADYQTSSTPVRVAFGRRTPRSSTAPLTPPVGPTTRASSLDGYRSRAKALRVAARHHRLPDGSPRASPGAARPESRSTEGRWFRRPLSWKAGPHQGRRPTRRGMPGAIGDDIGRRGRRPPTGRARSQVSSRSLRGNRLRRRQRSLVGSRRRGGVSFSAVGPRPLRRGAHGAHRSPNARGARSSPTPPAG